MNGEFEKVSKKQTNEFRNGFTIKHLASTWTQFTKILINKEKNSEMCIFIFSLLRFLKNVDIISKPKKCSYFYFYS